MTTTIETTREYADGIYENMSEIEYRAIDRMNPSTLEWGMESMAHLKAARDGELKQKTKALAFGTAGHIRLLEPHLYTERYAVRGPCGGTTGKGKPCSREGSKRYGETWYCQDHQPATDADDIEGLTTEEAEAIEAIATKIKKQPAVALLRQSGGCEVVILWTDPATGIKCKGKLDKWLPSCKLPGDSEAVPTILDLKYVCAVDERSLRNAIEEYGYHRRAAMYLDGIKVLTGLHADYMLVCIEKTAPYSVLVKSLGEASIKGGRWEFRNLISRWKLCHKSGVFPGYHQDIQEIEVPEWKLKEYGALAIGG